MTDVTVQFPGATSGFGRFVAQLRRSFSHAMMAGDMYRTLDELPDAILRDMGLARGEIAFAASAIASRQKAARHDADRLNS